MEKQLHVIVAPGAWQRGGVRYRRHWLANFLAGKPETAGVVWVFPLGLLRGGREASWRWPGAVKIIRWKFSPVW